MSIYDLVIESTFSNNEKIAEFEKNYKGLKIGVLGGTFDPIHNAHLATVEFIRCKYNLDKVILIPSGDPPHKTWNITNKYDRYNMVLLAIHNNKDFLAFNTEIEKKGKTYTVDTLRYLNEKYPGAEIFFVTGADAICDIEEWKDVEENFKLATFIAATRPGISLLKAQDQIENLEKKYNANIISVYVPSLDISSTYIRDQLKVGKTVRYLVPETVQRYIIEQNLYDVGDE